VLGKPNGKYNCKPVICKIMSGPFKSWSLAEYSGHLIPNRLQFENVHTFFDSSPLLQNCVSLLSHMLFLCIRDFCDRILKIKHDS